MLSHGYVTTPERLTIPFDWTSDNPAVVRIEQNSVRSAATGEATLTGRATDGSGLTLTLRVRVVEPLRLRFSQEELHTFEQRDITDQLRALLTGNFDTATDATVNWSVSEGSVAPGAYARVEDNRVRTLAAIDDGGYVTVTATSVPPETTFYRSDASSASIKLHIYRPQPTELVALQDPLQIFIPVGERNVDIREQIIGNLALRPEGLDLKDYDLQFESVRGAVTIFWQGTNAGLVWHYEAAYPGEEDVTAFILVPDLEGDPTGTTAKRIETTFHVVVAEQKEEARSVRWKDEYAGGVTLKPGDYATLDRILSTGYVTDPAGVKLSFEWTSADEHVVGRSTESSSGLTPLAAGTTTITGHTTEGPELTLTLQVTVIVPLNIKFTQTSVAMPEHQDITDAMRALLEGNFDEATDPTFTWRVEDGRELAEGHAKVEDNRVYTLDVPKYGNYVLLYVQANDYFGCQDHIELYITPAVVHVTDIRANEPSTHIVKKVGDEWSFDFTILPENATDKNYDVIIAYPDVVNYDYIINGREWFCALKPGQTQVTFVTDDGGYNITYDVVVTDGQAASVTDVRFAETELTLMREDVVGLPELIVEPEGSEIDPQLMTLSASPTPGGAEGLHLWRDEWGNWRMAGVTPLNGYTLAATYPTAYGTANLSIKIIVADRYDVRQGWNWIGFPFGAGSRAVYERIGGMKEMRSQNGAIAVDEQLGLFGDLTESSLEGGAGYKLFTATDGYFLTVPQQSASTALWTDNSMTTMLNEGWNWIASPLPRPLTLDQLFGQQLPDGTVVKTLDGASTYSSSDRQWVGSITSVDLHEGMMLQLPNPTTPETDSEGEDLTEDRYEEDYSLELRWPLMSEIGELKDYLAALETPAPETEPETEVHAAWSYDATATPTNMLIVAEADETAAEAGQCDVLAFVGDECRGRGVADGGLWHIVAHAEGGEQVSLRLYDRRADTFTPLTINGSESVAFGERLGSLKRPAKLATGSEPTWTGGDVTVWTDGNVLKLCGTGGARVTIADAAGKVVYSGTPGTQPISVAAYARGINIINVKGAQGSYSIKLLK